jgi:hypothetical protein
MGGAGMSVYRDAAVILAREAVLNEQDGDNVSVTIPIDAWRKFWEMIDRLDRATQTPYATGGNA